MRQGDVGPFANMVLGGTAGSLAELCTLPALFVRTRMQVQGIQGSRYTSFLHAMRTIIKEEGVAVFYKGATFNILMTPFARGLYIGGLELSRRTIGEGTPALDFVSGTAAQLVGSLAYVPRDIVLERCAIDGQLRSGQVGPAGSSADALRTILTKEGVRGFYRAYIPHQIVWIPFNGLFFTALGRIKAFEDKQLGMDTTRYSVGLGNTFLAAGFAAAVTNPIDVIKTRLQVAGANPEVFGTGGAVACVSKLLRTEGPGALFAGLGARFMYVGPGFAIWLPTYDLLKNMYLAGHVST
eukprot:gb/GEZN01009871.1/.p1 GENE.gb/GEZN01009871.1/~~gb/GEZN01009871.1/.p1  ORF type:complete len:296 (-),score=21.21 gb/GEZN01009871.1/:41-928(-)